MSIVRSVDRCACSTLVHGSLDDHQTQDSMPASTTNPRRLLQNTRVDPIHLRFREASHDRPTSKLDGEITNLPTPRALDARELDS